MILKDLEFSSWEFHDVLVNLRELPTRIYYSFSTLLLEFFIVELHALNHINSENWEKDYSVIAIIGSGQFGRKGLNMKLNVDHTSSSETLLNIFNKLSEMDPHHNE